MADSLLLMSPAPATGARFEISVDGVVRTHRDVREIAIDAARVLAQRHRGAAIKVTDLRDGSEVPIEL